MNGWHRLAIDSGDVACPRVLGCFLEPYCCPPHCSMAEVRLPNGEYTESTDDLKVKVLGGFVTVARSWTNGRWYINPAWADLKLTIDSLDGSVSALDRAGSIYERSGNGIFIFDKRFFIQTTASGYRWYDQRGNWITYDANGHMTAYGDRNNVQVTFQLDTNGQRTQSSRPLQQFGPDLPIQRRADIRRDGPDRTPRPIRLYRQQSDPGHRRLGQHLDVHLRRQRSDNQPHRSGGAHDDDSVRAVDDGGNWQRLA